MMKMGPDPKLFDDLARMAGGAVNILSGMQQQVQSEIKTRIDELATRLDLVPREDLERAEARIAKLEKTVADLAARLDGSKTASRPKAETKTGTKKGGKKP